MEHQQDGRPVAPPETGEKRAPYRAPRLERLGLAAALTARVSNRGMMDGFMGRRTG